jgi:hypothetical protein
MNEGGDFLGMDWMDHVPDEEEDDEVRRVDEV